MRLIYTFMSPLANTQSLQKVSTYFNIELVEKVSKKKHSKTNVPRTVKIWS